MTSTKRRAAAGDWIAVPLPLNHWAPGRIVGAGSHRRGHILTVYFFSPLESVTAEGICRRVHTLAPSEAVLVTKCSDLALRAGRWPVVERSGADTPQLEWPNPIFVRHGGRWGVQYSLDDPSEPILERELTETEAGSCPADGMAGSEWVEERLAHLAGLHMTAP